MITEKILNALVGLLCLIVAVPVTFMAVLVLLSAALAYQRFRKESKEAGK